MVLYNWRKYVDKSNFNYILYIKDYLVGRSYSIHGSVKCGIGIYLIHLIFDLLSMI